MDNPEPRAQYLNVVLRQIEKTALRIPRFQRHFVWTESDVLELLSSIEKGYPIGSVLTWKVAASDGYFSGFREKPFPSVDESVGTFEVILDGAQRLSTLYGALRNADADRIYKVAYDLKRRDFFHYSDHPELEDWHVPMSALFESRRFLEVQRKISELDVGDVLLPIALDLYTKFQDYQIPLIALANAALEDVVEVFRRINSSGTPLSTVDFVRALTWRSSFDLEETFEQFVDRYDDTSLAGLTEEFLVRCLSIVAGLSLDSRDVVQLKALSNRAGGLDAEVSEMEGALSRLAEFLETLHVAAIREVPYEVQRLLLFSLMLYRTQVDWARLREWFWQSTFAEEHQSKPESYTTRLVRELRGGNVAPTLEVRRAIDPHLLAKRARRSGSAVATGYDLLLRVKEQRSLLSGEVVADLELHRGHLFSREQLSDGNGEENSAAGVLANLVVLSPTDALEWKRLREQLTLPELFAHVQARTGDAAAIWGSQGISVRLNSSPVDVLRERSANLLSWVLPLQVPSDLHPD